MKLTRLTIRDLFWLVLLCAVFTAWALDHWRAAKQIEELTAPLKKKAEIEAEIRRRIEAFNRGLPPYDRTRAEGDALDAEGEEVSRVEIIRLP